MPVSSNNVNPVETTEASYVRELSGFTVVIHVKTENTGIPLGPETNHVTNGLLLRADIHTLFSVRGFRRMLSNAHEVFNRFGHIGCGLRRGRVGAPAGGPQRAPVDSELILGYRSHFIDCLRRPFMA